MVVDVRIISKLGSYLEAEQISLSVEEFFKTKLFHQKYVFESLTTLLTIEMYKDIESYLKKMCIWFSKNALFIQKINFDDPENPIITLEKSR